ncbi:adenylosuccinate lyase [Fulvivirga sedimenti]|uniref:Adenylosuccinate lyase n=1 Tax=Fulvivirga sedimenti TaxID=2879465 RepID=A0A9X1HNZ0_9BACT|nr:adenylosuccinate lyase [Fulvivirga sedimenti]MCA6075306.1 adenylosuccinate lyase [Fulvivirga sedimenti]MCA6076483.1 adenylosuccinate lyase [Fulvivirga sedimenti]MCA6077611.1 adenylosuccinate lyase [Fulvivirga sedimenti]
MDNAALNAISPIDGRYRKQTSDLIQYFSEFGLIRYRVQVEIEYFIALVNAGIPQLASVDQSVFDSLRNIYVEFSSEDAAQIKEIEKTTNHDVKAVEYFIKEKFDDLGLSEQKEFIHFGLTSQDINNTAIPLSLKAAMEEVVMPLLEAQVATLQTLSKEWKDVPMLARTHGQPASPTRMGKEIEVFAVRLQEQISQLKAIPFAAKFGGATGNFNAHHVAYPKTDWKLFGNRFVEEILGLKRSQPTTQIEHYDHLAALFDALKRINTIFIDFSRDIWQYISMHYFNQKIRKGEVGSSAMPHKVNPIDFENAEGNLGIANALFEHLSAKLPISRLQRDLTDSTVLRNIGVPLGHSLIALRSLEKGLGKLEINIPAIEQDLEDNWAVVAEAIQTVLRREGFPKPYEALKELTRKNEKITRNTMAHFIAQLHVSDEIKEELSRISPYNYTGI